MAGEILANLTKLLTKLTTLVQFHCFKSSILKCFLSFSHALVEWELKNRMWP